MFALIILQLGWDAINQTPRIMNVDKQCSTNSCKLFNNASRDLLFHA